MIKFVYIIYVFLVISFCGSANAQFSRINDEFKNTCVFIMDSTGTESNAIGSGFLIGYKESDKDFIYLVTAKHVLDPNFHPNGIIKNATTPLYLRFNSKNKFSKTIKITEIIYKEKRFFSHKNPLIDIAVMVLPLSDLSHELDLRVLGPIENNTSENIDFATKNWLIKHEIGTGDPVFICGLIPELYYLSKNKNIIVTRFGMLSNLWVNLNYANNPHQTVHILDCPAFGGNSGGPAFLTTWRDNKGTGLTIGGERIGGTPTYALLGVVSAFVSSPIKFTEISTNSKKVLTSEELKSQKATIYLENTNLSRIIPVDYLLEILNSEEQNNLRDALIKYDNKKRHNDK
ncbi:MAG: trypsin-like peptidase domain-containing protein [Candidatus Omnitrophica bacterium]|nr:trypsin-like peptidase domain-containing protein [Candidatus Omnitrophota bacterium]